MPRHDVEEIGPLRAEVTVENECGAVLLEVPGVEVLQIHGVSEGELAIRIEGEAGLLDVRRVVEELLSIPRALSPGDNSDKRIPQGCSTVPPRSIDGRA